MSDGDHISPWMPEQNPLRLAVLGKLGEEANELSGRAWRCVIQGIDEIDPDTGRTNREELQREVTDVLACLAILSDRLGIVQIDSRLIIKHNGYRRWHDMIAEPAKLSSPGGDE